VHPIAAAGSTGGPPLAGETTEQQLLIHAHQQHAHQHEDWNREGEHLKMNRAAKLWLANLQAMPKFPLGARTGGEGLAPAECT